jgi:hypothetical protein
MANANPLRIGQVNQTGDVRNLFLKIYGGMVVTAFRRKTAFMDKHLVRNIPHGKSAQFPRTGKVSAYYHTPGQEILGDQSNQAEAVITVDDILVSALFIPEIDELISHYEVRSEYAHQQGEELANIYDMNVARVALQAARAANPVTGLPGGTQLVAATALTDADVFAEMLFESQARMAEKNVPDGDRWCFVKPDLYYRLVSSSSKAIHRDFAGAGSYADGVIIRIAGLPIVMTNNLPTANDTSNTAIHSKYRANYSGVAGMVMHRSAVGTVKLKDMAVESTWDPRRLGDLLTARYLVGHGWLRPESVVELRTTAL